MTWAWLYIVSLWTVALHSCLVWLDLGVVCVRGARRFSRAFINKNPFMWADGALDFASYCLTALALAIEILQVVTVNLAFFMWFSLVWNSLNSASCILQSLKTRILAWKYFMPASRAARVFPFPWLLPEQSPLVTVRSLPSSGRCWCWLVTEQSLGRAQSRRPCLRIYRE